MKNYDKTNLERIVKESLSIADVCRALDMRAIGGNYKTVKKYIKIHNIDTSHFTGSAWNVGMKYKNFSKIKPLSEILVKDSLYTNTNKLRKRLINEGLKDNECEICHIVEWNNKSITFHLDHINGDNLDNRLNNLRILCPNCHSQTETYCKGSVSSINELRSKIFKLSNQIEKSKEEDKEIKQQNLCKCGNLIEKRSTICLDCHHYSLRKVKERPSKEVLLREVKELGYCGVGRKYNVTDNCIRKWIRNSK